MTNIKTIPLFPLNIVAFPGERVNLHIFEDRYVELINDCTEAEDDDGFTFGIPAYLDGQIMDFGTEMRLVEVVKKYPDGKMDIRLEGLSVFRIIEFFQLMPFKKYSGARVSIKEMAQDSDIVLQESVRVLVAQLFDEIGLERKIEAFSAFSVAHYIGMSLKQEYDLLTTFSEAQRLIKVIHHLEKVIPSVQQTRKIRDQIQMNGHFRKLMPPF